MLYAAREAPAEKLRETVKLAIVLLGPSGKRARPRDPRKAERRTTVKELDALCRRVVFARDGGKCRRCGAPAIDWSHVVTRATHATRWDLDGSFASCKGCHVFWWHKHPLEAVAWWEEQIGSRAYNALKYRAARPSKVNTIAVRAYLIEEAKKLGLEVPHGK